MPVTKVAVTEDCVACGMCESICPNVFAIEEIAVVKGGVDFAADEDCIREAADACPVEAIKIEG